MAYSPVATPATNVGPGALFIAPLGTSLPANTVAGSVFSVDWSTVPAWIALGATEDGMEFSYSTTVEPIEVAEFFDPIQYATTARAGSVTFNLASWTASNYQRAINAGVGALAPTSGTGATALYTIQPPAVGSEVRCMIGWESQDHTIRLVAYQTIQGGDVASPFRKSPTLSVIPCTFNFEVPSSGIPYSIYTAGSARG